MAGQERWLLERSGLQPLLDALRAGGYQPIGPVPRDGAIVYDALDTVDDLPAGWTDRQDGGAYRLERRADQALFGYAVGPHAWKRFLHEPRLRLWRARRTGSGFSVEAPAREAPRYAFVGVRACELHAIAIQDRVLLGDRFQDPAYRARREGAFIVALSLASDGSPRRPTAANRLGGGGCSPAVRSVNTETDHFPPPWVERSGILNP